ncbi:hypothetical protein Tco_1272745 [Tanacetum coccineum]
MGLNDLHNWARGFNAVKPSACWVWRPIKPNGASLSNSQLNDKGFVDSGCSRHMTGNIAHLSDFKDFDGGYVTFGGGALSIQGVSESSTSSQQDQDNQDCIVMPIWKDASYFGDVAPRSVADAQIQDKDGLHDENDATKKSHDDSSLKDNGTAVQQVNTARPEINTGSREVSTAVPEVNTATPEDLVGPSHASEDTQVEDQEVELGNIPQSYAVPTTPHTRIHKDHPIEHVIGKTHQDLHTCLFACFLSQEEPKRVSKALSDPTWVEAMQEELLQFKLQKVWILMDLPKGHRAIGTKWEDGFDYDEVLHLWLELRQSECSSYASTWDFMVTNGCNKVLLYVQSMIWPASSHTELDGDADDVDEHLYKSIIGSLMYLTASRPDIMFAVCACARFQVSPKTSHLLAVKRIFRYLKVKPSLGLWYSKDSPFELVTYTNSDYAGATQDRK